MGYNYTHQYPHTKFHHCSPYRTLDAFLLQANQNRYANEGRYVHSVMKDHVGSTSAHHYPHTKFHHCSPNRTLNICLSYYQPIRADMQMRYKISTFGDDRQHW